MILLAFGLVLIVEGLAYALAPSLIETDARGAQGNCLNRHGGCWGCSASSAVLSCYGAHYQLGFLTS